MRTLTRPPVARVLPALVAGVPLGVLVAGLLSVRPVADDLCYEAELAARGLADAWVHYMTTWTTTWLHHLVLLLVAAAPGWTGYLLQAAVLVTLLGVTAWTLTRDRLAAAVLLACSLAALQGSLVGPAYPGLTGSLAWPSASVLHLLPVLLWLPLTARWHRRSGPPPAAALALAAVLAGLGTAEGGAALVVWGALAALSRRDGPVARRWLVPALVLGGLLAAVFLAPGSDSRTQALEAAPSSAALDLPPLVALPVYAVLYLGGVVTSPGVLVAFAAGLLVLRPAPLAEALVPLLAAGALLAAAVGAAVFAYPAFWHLQGVQLASCAAALAVGRALAPRLGRAGPAAPAVLVPALAVVVVVALVPALATAAALRARADAVDAALRDGTLPGYALGTPGGAHVPDAGAGLPGLEGCWARWTGTAPAPAPLREGPRGVLPTVPLDVLG